MNLYLKKKPVKILALCLIFLLAFYQLSFSLAFSSYAREKACDPNDNDYQECLYDNEQSRLEDEQKAQRKQAEQQAEQEREAREALIEEHEDDPTWVPPWLATPTPTPTPAPSPTAENLVDSLASNELTGEDSTNTTDSNSATNINVEDINSTTLDEQVNLLANSGNNVISQSGDPQTTSQGTDNGSNLTSQTQALGPAFAGEAEDQNGESDTTGDLTTQNPNQGIEETGFSQEAGNDNQNHDGDSSQEAISSDTDVVTVANQNYLEAEITLIVDSTSGKNQSLDNEEDIRVEAGSGQSNAIMQNQGNTNFVDVKEADGAEAVNGNTNEDSTNLTQDEVSQTIKVTNENQAAVETNLSVTSTSGENDLSQNQGEATLTTKETEIVANLINILNLNITGSDFTHLIVNLFGDMTGEVNLEKISEDYLCMDEDEVLAIARNVSTGDNSQNTALASYNQNLEISNQNQAALINNVDVKASTGENTLSGNEDNVDALTGRIKILTSIMNFINANFSGTDWYFAMVNIFGSLKGDLVLPDPNHYLANADGTLAVNQGTGPNSQNLAGANSQDNISSQNDNNAQVKNRVDVTGDSGSNLALGNEDETTIDTGDVGLTAQIMNWLNYNLFGTRWVMVVVNVFGQWMGKIIAFPGQGDIAAPESGTLVAMAQGQGGQETSVEAENQNTGEGSQNQAEASVSLNLDVANENKAYLENNVNIEGVSGRNETSGNEDKTNLATGWINLDVNLFNIVNFNVTGRNWMLLMVNVFGDFFGNIVFPHEEIAVAPAIAQESAGIGGPSGSEGASHGGDNVSGADSLSSDSSSETQAADQQTENRLINERLGTLALSKPRTIIIDSNGQEVLDFSEGYSYNQIETGDEAPYSLIENSVSQEEDLIFRVWQIFDQLILYLSNIIGGIL